MKPKFSLEDRLKKTITWYQNSFKKTGSVSYSELLEH